MQRRLKYDGICQPCEKQSQISYGELTARKWSNELLDIETWPISQIPCKKLYTLSGWT